MTQIQCPRCHETLKSMNVLDLHMLGEERCYTEGTPIAEEIKRRINTLHGQVDYLLHRFPSTRSSDNFLEGFFAVCISKTKTYDPATQAFREKQGIPLAKLKYQVKASSLSRLRRFSQKEDRENYHHKDLSIKQEHDCILASSQVSLRRSIEDQESRKLWAINGIK